MPDLCSAQDFYDKAPPEVTLTLEGTDRYRVDTPHHFNDGDHFKIVLKKDRSAWVLSDEAHTMMHLADDIDWCHTQGNDTQKPISDALSAFQVENRDGELVLPVRGVQFGEALSSFAQSILKISEVTGHWENSPDASNAPDVSAMPVPVAPPKPPQDERTRARRLKRKGLGNKAIARRLRITENQAQQHTKGMPPGRN